MFKVKIDQSFIGFKVDNVSLVVANKIALEAIAMTQGVADVSKYGGLY